MQFFQAFGIDWKIVLAQLLNFGILMFILYKIGYKPLMKFVEERTNRIEEGVKNAERAQAALANAKAEQEQILAEARKEAVAIIESARQKATEQGDALIAKAKQEVGAVVVQGKKAIETERQKMLDEVKRDVVEMVMQSTEKVLAGAIDDQVDASWLKKQLAKVK